MEDWISTLAIAFVLIAFALAGLAVSWLLTGKSRLIRGGCGKAPGQVKKEGCDEANEDCSLCHGDSRKHAHEEKRD